MAIKVTLLAHTPNPEQTVAMAAKLCYSPSGIEDIREGLTEEKTESFINMLSNLGHGSPFEHITFTFGIEGVSRACSHQLVRHRIASYSQQSQRYVNGESFEYVIPPEIEKNEKALKIYNEAIDKLSSVYKQVRDELFIGHLRNATYEKTEYPRHSDAEIFKNMFKTLYPKEYSALEKKANEDARYILPNACTTKIVCTFNARSLANFFGHRCCNRAQWEIREVANQMLTECLKVAPNIFKNCGANCISGKCPEGNMSCGKQKEVREQHDIMVNKVANKGVD